MGDQEAKPDDLTFDMLRVSPELREGLIADRRLTWRFRSEDVVSGFRNDSAEREHADQIREDLERVHQIPQANQATLVTAAERDEDAVDRGTASRRDAPASTRGTARRRTPNR